MEETSSEILKIWDDIFGFRNEGLKSIISENRESKSAFKPKSFHLFVKPIFVYLLSWEKLFQLHTCHYREILVFFNLCINLIGQESEGGKQNKKQIHNS